MMSNNSKSSASQPISRNNPAKEIRNGSGCKDNSNLESLLKKTNK